MTDLIDVHQSNGVLVTTSRNVAEVFEKNHKDVLRDIRNLLDRCSKEFTERNFAPSEYTDPTGRKLAEYLLTKDGVVVLIMGYTGESAMKFKEAYIKRFNEMEASLQEKILKTQEVDLDRLHKEVLLTADALKAAGYTPTKIGLALNELMLKATGKDYFAIMGVHLEEPEPKEEELLTPTEIGVELGISNRVVNQLLKKVGLQYKPENSHIWLPTEKGIEQGAKVINVCKKSSIGTTTQLKWSTKVINVLRDYLE